MPEFAPRETSLHRTWPSIDRRSMTRHPATWSIRGSLVMLVIACLLPGILMSTYIIVADYQQNKARALHDALATARTVTASLDRDIASITSGLRVLATSNTLLSGDLAQFYQHAHSALPFQNISNYVLIDPQGRQQLNTLRAWGTPLPTVGGPPQLLQVFHTGAPVLTDVFIGPVTGKPILGLGVPVQRDGQIIYSLNAGIFPERFAELLRTQGLPQTWISAILDSKGLIVARTHDTARYVAKPAVPDLIRMAHENREGVLETVTLEGIPVVTAFSRSSISDWTVAVGIPRAELTARLKTSLVWLSLVSTLLFAGALWFAWWLALSRVVIPADRLLARMTGISRGQSASPPDCMQAGREFKILEQGLIDMGAQLQLREIEREAKLAAEAANHAKTEFLSRMSHELRTPLNAVLGFAQVLKLDQTEYLSPRQYDMINQIESSGQHLLDMISDVLDVSRIESGVMHMAIADVDIVALLAECHQMICPEAAAYGLQLELDTPADLPWVRADKTRLKQILLNLLSNAIKYNRPHGVIRLSAQHLGHMVRLGIQDTGLGMNPEQVAHLFEPFNRLGREHSGTPGTGIGLVICQRLLTNLDSRLQYTTTEGEGSTFYFDLAVAA